jgi:hypothetical protein
MNIFVLCGWLSFIVFFSSECATPQEIIQQASQAIEQEIQSSRSASIDDFGVYLFDKLSLPKKLDDILRKLILTDGKLNKNIKGLYDGFQVLGNAKIFNTPVKISILYGEQQLGKIGASCTITFPDQWQYAQLDRNLAFLDKLTLAQPRLIISTVEYDDPDLELKIPMGLNVLAGVDFVGALEPLQQFIDLIKKLPGIKLDDLGKIFLRGNLPFGSPTGATFAVILPIKFGVDFKDLHDKKKLPIWPKPIESVEIDGFSVVVKPTLSFNLASAINVALSTKPDPLTFKGKVSLSKSKVSISGKLDSTIELFKGLKIGDLALELFSDVGVVALTGVPFSGIGLRGVSKIGTGKDMATIDVAGKLDVSTTSMSEFILAGEIDNIGIRALTSMVADIANTKIVIPKELDFIKLQKGKIYIVPGFDANIEGKLYEPGLHLSAMMKLFGIMGEMSFYVDKEEMGLKGHGRLQPINTSVLKITRSNLKGSKEKILSPEDIVANPYAAIYHMGPKIDLDFRPFKKIFNFTIDGAVVVPGLVNKKTLLHIGDDAIHAHFVEKLWGFLESDIQLTIDPKKPDDFVLSLRGAQDLNLLLQKVQKAILKFRDAAHQEFEKAKKIMNKAKNDFSSDVQQEYNRINELLGRRKAERDRLRKRCNVDKVVGICLFKLPTAEIEVEAIEKVYKDFILKHGSKVVKTLGPDMVNQLISGLTKATQKLSEWSVVLTKVGDIAIIKSIKGIIRGRDLKQGKLPHVTVTFKNGTTASVQLDGKKIITDIINAIKKI